MHASPPTHITRNTDSTLTCAIAILCLSWLALSWPWLSGDFTIPWDTKAQFQPQIQFLAHSLHTYQSPFWTPNVFSGHPQIADPQSLIFQPPFLILAALIPEPGSHAIDATILLCILAGTLALFAWCNDQRWHPGAGILAALAFAFGAAMAWRLQHTGQILSMCYLAGTLLFLDRMLAKHSVMYALAAGLTAALMVLGRDQVALLGVYVLIGHVVWRILASSDPSSPTAKNHSIAHRLIANSLPLTAAAAVAAILIAGPILLTYLLAENSNRPSIDLEGAGRGSLHPALLLTFIAPDVFGSSGRMEDYWGPPSFAWSDTGLYIAQNMGQLYIGAIPVLLILTGLATGGLFNRQIRGVTITTVLLVLYALGWFTPVFAFAHAYLPGIDYYRRPADAVFLIGFGAAILAGYCAHSQVFQLAGARKKSLPNMMRAIVSMTILASLLGAAGLAWHFDRMQTASGPLLQAVAIFTLAALTIAAAQHLAPKRPAVAAALLIAFMVADLKLNNGPGSATALPTAHYEALEPNTKNPIIRFLKANARQTDTRRDRVEMAGLGFHWPNASLSHDLEHISGYNPLRSALYIAATATPDSVGLPTQRKFAKLFPSYTSPMGNMLGLRFIATGLPIEKIDPNVDQTKLTLVHQTPKTWIYENPHTLPRVTFARRAQHADFEELLKTGQWPDFDPTMTVILNQAMATKQNTPTSPTEPDNSKPGQARILKYENTRITVAAESRAGGYVVLNDIWHPWWTAKIDGQDTTLHRANVLFRAVRVPPGKHLIEFSFQPMQSAIRTVYDRIWPHDSGTYQNKARQRP